ncbi:DUF4873 domain-containing protein [Mycobacterium sp. PS03-16]|uniref:DUF4873 domain-containing protein n=1 Tax=Mycobacterium sp. PS03-16 TaxID=2559611 RepID=UPI00107414B7|nr:DUF4873 domain-containing protein [Mycobacterium sp. PS03-16]TFV61126.1 DUF4873 domain-containing protein [Mycobacterium sp. PS03-16]
MSTPLFDVVVIDAPELRDALGGDVLSLSGPAVAGARFDETAHRWTIDTGDGTVDSGLVISAADGNAPYLGVAEHGRPNWFSLAAAEPLRTAQVRFIAECLRLMAATGSTRIEVRHSAQREAGAPARTGRWFWHRMRRRIGTAFDFSSHVAVEDEVYDGPADLGAGDTVHAVRVRLSGHLDPIDGRYHWRGLILDALPDDALPRSGAVTVTIDGRTAPGRIAERTPWGSHAVAGVGTPPFALDDVVVSIPAH